MLLHARLMISPIAMRQIKILLVDLEGASDQSGLLQEILEPTFLISRIVKTNNETALFNEQLSAALADFQPALNFLILSRRSLEQNAETLESSGVLSTRVPSIFVFESGEPDETFALLKLGAADFITPPFKAADILPRIWRLLEQQQRAESSVPERIKQRTGLKHLIGESHAFLAEVKKIPLVARCDASVLINGETGTGKEVYARAIHYLSPRATKPFIPVNCGAIPVELLENELFGHERGAFTGALATHSGLLQEAEGGTLFLDEIDCLPALAQIKLLRFMQEKEYRRLGSTKTLHADVRVIGASNTNLEDAVREGRLRSDLYYRLNVIRLRLPPLRERREDIPLLARHFLKKYASESGAANAPASIPPDAMQTLLLHDWPGNVRELEHVIERAVVLSEDATIHSFDFNDNEPPEMLPAETFQQAKAKMIDQFEKSYIQRLLAAHDGNITKAAASAQKNRRAFWQLIRKHHINARNFKPAH
jgi:two-component system response regulator GlrR